MKRLLHLVASPRAQESRTLRVAQAYLQSFSQAHPDVEIDTLDLFQENIPELSVLNVKGKYVLMGGGEITGDLKTQWEKIEEHIQRFVSADHYLVSSPMWNFSIPYKLKQYIDLIAQPGYTFRYTEKGPEGLVTGKKMVIVTSRGGDYSKEPASQMDHLNPYLKTLFSFFGFKDIQFIDAQPMDAGGPEVREQKLAEAFNKATGFKQFSME